MWPSNTIPRGWLLCDGSIYDQAAYPALFAVIAENYTSGDYPQLPDLRTRVPYATGSIAATGGVSTVTLSGPESGLKSHTHTFLDYYPENDYNACSGSARSSLKSGAIATETSSGVYVGESSYAFDGFGYPAQAAHTNLQPYLLINFIIKT
jgi:microcystin-dependent protein